MDTAKQPGWKTSEFRVLVGYALVALGLDVALMTGLITPQQAHDLQLQTPAIVANAGVALSIPAYILARSGLKWTWLQSVGQQILAATSQQPLPTLAPINDGPASPSYAQPRTATQPSTAQAPQASSNNAAAPAGTGASL